MCTSGQGRREFHYSTPIRSDTLECAIIYMKDSYLYDYDIYYYTYKGAFNPAKLKEDLYHKRSNKFYDPLNYQNYVNLNKNHILEMGFSPLTPAAPASATIQGIPVLITNSSTGEVVKKCKSQKEAAEFLGVNKHQVSEAVHFHWAVKGNSVQGYFNIRRL